MINYQNELSTGHVHAKSFEMFKQDWQISSREWLHTEIFDLLNWGFDWTAILWNIDNCVDVDSS